MNGIVGILLAAGSGERFGSHKLLASLPDGERIGARAARNLVTAVPESVAVIRAGDNALADILSAAGMRAIQNPSAASGIAGSIAAGVAACPDADGWLIALGDMPWIRPKTIRSVADELRSGASLVAPSYNDRRGHPVGFCAQWRPRLLSLVGDEGAKYLIEGAGSSLRLLPTTDAGTIEDVDLPTDLASTLAPRTGLRRS